MPRGTGKSSRSAKSGTTRGTKSTRTTTKASKASTSKRSRGASASASRTQTRASSDTAAKRADGIEPVDHESDAAARQKLLASDKLYYRIGEVSKLTDVKAHVLRYWETEFRWMAPPKSRSKQRLYRKRDIEFVWLLKRLLWEERYTIAGARQRIQELGVEDALALLDQPPGTSASKSEVDAAVHAASAEQWVSFRAALDEMQVELTALRGVLREGT